MALTVYLCGHGSWKPDSGYFSMPKGCSMSFIVHHAKCLYTEDMFRVCGGNWPNEPVSIINEYKSCPNMTWTVDEASKKTRCANELASNPKHRNNNPAKMIFPSSTKTLREFFDTNAAYIRSDVRLHGNVIFIWNCCTALELNLTKQGGQIGINAAEGSQTYDYVDFSNGSPLFLNIHTRK
jgi:hypothetical protein